MIALWERRGERRARWMLKDSIERGERNQFIRARGGMTCGDEFLTSGEHAANTR